MVLGISDVHEIVRRVCARPDVIDACRKRDLGTVIAVLGAHGVSQGQIAALTGIPQGRLSEYKTGKRVPSASSTFESFADGVGMPAVAREALGLAPGRLVVVGSGHRLPDEPGPDNGLRYSDDPAEVADNLTSLWRTDLDDESALQGGIEPSAWRDASLAWLVSSEHHPAEETAAGIRIGMADVARFRSTAEMFVQLDNRFGGGHARASLVQYLSTDAERMLRGQYTQGHGKVVHAV